jgi:cytoskeletal protein RodZ
VPRSRIRRRSAFTPPPEKTRAASLVSPRWLVPVMVISMVLGLLWVVVYYVTQTEYPIKSFGNFNMLVGFGLIAIGFGLATRWK